MKWPNNYWYYCRTEQNRQILVLPFIVFELNLTYSFYFFSMIKCCGRKVKKLYSSYICFEN
jgi:hypothetical protein